MKYSYSIRAVYWPRLGRIKRLKLVKTLFLLSFLIIPLLSRAQQKESWWKRGRERARQEKEDYKKPVSFTSPLDEAGYTLQKGSSMVIGGLACEVLGGGIIAAGASQSDGDKIIIIGGAATVTGFIIQLIGLSKIGTAGKLLRTVKLSGNGLSVNLP